MSRHGLLVHVSFFFLRFSSLLLLLLLLLVCRSPSPELPSVLTAPSPTHSQVEAGMYTSLDAFASDVRRIAMNCELLYGGGIHSRPDIVAEASALVYRFESMLAAGNAFGLTSAVRDRRLARGVCARARARSFCKTNAPRAHTLTFLSFAGLSLSRHLSRRDCTPPGGERGHVAGGTSHGHSAHSSRWSGAPSGFSRSPGHPHGDVRRTASVGRSYPIFAILMKTNF